MCSRVHQFFLKPLVYFWQRKTRAAEIFAEHISPEADEQVNVTGVIEKDIENNLETAASTLFDSAQKHVSSSMCFVS